MVKVSLLLLTLVLAGPAAATIDLLPKMIEVQPEESGTVKIINNSDHAEFVSITLSRLLNPGVPYEEEKQEAVSMAREPHLYAYPFRLSLSPGQSKDIVLKPLATVSQEEVYRLDVKPVTAIVGNTSESVNGGVAINLSFSALVRQLPETQNSKMSVSCLPDGVMLSASGTSRYTVKGLNIDGAARDDFNIYPGTPLSFTGHTIIFEGKVLCSH